jgi:para-nitrobenzyl esterase
VTQLPAARLGLRSLAALILITSMAACTLHPGSVQRLVNAPDRRDVTVMTATGPVVGVSSSMGQAFLGIPYAAPPVGPLRFRAPQPAPAWSAPRDATVLGPDCIQGIGAGRAFGLRGSLMVLGSEDCLSLNVYAPADAAPGAHLPVMVWIYGGGFGIGAGGWYDPSVLAARNGVIVVTLNYRLGAFGFLAHPALRAEADEGSGSFALLDQQAALRWVKANIAQFGGHPGNVTLFGESAGGFSVCYHLASPGAAGLFQRAIIESGSCTSPNAVVSRAEGERGGQEMAAELGCTDAATALECLRSKSASEIKQALPHRRGLMGPRSWSPVHGNAVLPLPPVEAFREGRVNRVPVINGSNRDEGRLFAGGLHAIGRMRSEASYAERVVEIFGVAAPKVLSEYPAETYGSPALAFAEVLTDAMFACPARTLDRLLARHQPVYAYEFDDPEAVNNLPRLPGLIPPRAFHASEIAYVLQASWALADPVWFSPAQKRLSDRMQGYWTTFARSGDPNREDAELWPAFRGDNEMVQSLNPARIAPADGFAARHKCAFWAQLGF